MHHDEVETEQEDGVHLEKCSDAMILSVAAGAGGDRLNMKLSHHCSLCRARQIKQCPSMARRRDLSLCNCTHPTINYQMQAGKNWKCRFAVRTD